MRHIHHDLAGAVAHHGDFRLRHRRVGIDRKVVPVGRHLNLVVGVLWREEVQLASVKAHAVEVAEIWVVIFLLADSDEINYAVLWST